MLIQYFTPKTLNKLDVCDDTERHKHYAFTCLSPLYITTILVPITSYRSLGKPKSYFQNNLSMNDDNLQALNSYVVISTKAQQFEKIL